MSEPDLKSLRIDAEAARPRRPIAPRLLAGLVIVLLGAVTVTFVYPLIRPTRAVRTAPVRAAAVDNGGSAAIAGPGQIAAEAVGWVEPDPFATIVRPLVAGRIRTLDVLEGQRVTAGETVLATLESAALTAAAERTAATVREREAELAVKQAELQKARDHRDQHAEHRTLLAQARLALAARQRTLADAEGRARELTAKARAADATREAHEKLAAAGTKNAVALERVVAESAAADAAAAAAVRSAEAAALESAAAERIVALHRELIDRPVDLDNAVLVAAAAVGHAEGRLALARTELTIAERELGWAERVLAPVDGIVLRLIAAPGHTTGPGGEGIVALYDAARLQARIDVPLDSVAGVHVGQTVELSSEITGTATVRGEVLRIQHETDLLKNTLQVKVRLVDPPELWRPETLCRARFLGRPRPAGSGDGDHGDGAFLVPKDAVQNGSVFVIDPTRGVARGIAVEVVGEQNGAAIVRGDLSVTQKLILDPVTAGEAVQEQTR